MPLDHRPLGDSGISVPSLCLGTMMYGDQIGEADAFRQMDRCFERGLNFFDTADHYNYGDSEEITGRMLKKYARRDEIVVATKVGLEEEAGRWQQVLDRGVAGSMVSLR